MQTRALIGVALAAALSLWGTIEYFGFEPVYQKQNRDPYKIAMQTPAARERPGDYPREC